jgi:glycosyltransferase involved in cell wall biosynthesis
LSASISVVVPVYAGAKFLPNLFTALAEVRGAWQHEARPFALNEVIFVDGAAVDESPRLLDELSATASWSRIIYLSRSYGQHPATIAGILHSAGDWIFTIDEDLQHNPKHFTTMLELAVTTVRDIV